MYRTKNIISMNTSYYGLSKYSNLEVGGGVDEELDSLYVVYVILCKL